MKRGVGMRRVARIALAVVAVVVIAGVAGGCTSSTSGLGTSESQCFRSLPAARTAVHDRGRLLGVRLLTVADINADLKRTRQQGATLTSPLARATSSVCAIGYQDSYTNRTVEDPWPPDRTQGADALVLVEVRTERVLATVLLSKPPLRLSRL